MRTLLFNLQLANTRTLSDGLICSLNIFGLCLLNGIIFSVSCTLALTQFLELVDFTTKRKIQFFASRCCAYSALGWTGSLSRLGPLDPPASFESESEVENSTGTDTSAAAGSGSRSFPEPGCYFFYFFKFFFGGGALICSSAAILPLILILVLLCHSHNLLTIQKSRCSFIVASSLIDRSVFYHSSSNSNSNSKRQGGKPLDQIHGNRINTTALISLCTYTYHTRPNISSSILNNYISFKSDVSLS